MTIRTLLASASVALSLLTVECTKAPEPATTAAPLPAATNSIVRLDPALDSLVPAGAAVEKIGGPFKFIEGPLWRPSGVLWFSDLVGNVMLQWSPDGKITEMLRPGGYDKTDAPEGAYIGPNAMAAGPDNTVALCQHGNRRIVRLSSDAKVIGTIVDKYQGKRINSPNDLVYAPDGSLYFTDPPFGLPKLDADPAKELKFNAVFRLQKGKLTPVIKDVPLPNGIAFSPDYKILYISNSEQDHRNWMRYDVAADGSVANGRVFADASSSPDTGVPDGMKVDSQGNVYAAGPGGVWIFSPDGKHLGTLKMTETPSNCAWGDDGKTLYITAMTGLYRIKLSVAGEKPVYN
jgi:gluconolactonase